MSTLPNHKPWDFSHVLDLVSALSLPKEQAGQVSHDRNAVERTPLAHNDRATGVDSKDFAPSPAASLGDFGKIWHFLGTQPPQSRDASKLNPDTTNAFTSKADYTSDGAVRYGLRAKSNKRVTWKEETSADEPTPDSASELEAASTLEPPKLTKSQRKKLNRRERKAREASAGQGTVSESEADSIWLATPARKASTHTVPAQSAHRSSLMARYTIGATPDPPSHVGQNGSRENDKPTQQNGHLHVTSTGSPIPQRPETSIRHASHPLVATQSAYKPAVKQAVDKTPNWPIAGPKASTNMKFLPASVSPHMSTPKTGSQAQLQLPNSAAKAVLAVQAAKAKIGGADKSLTSLPTRQPTIAPKIVRTGEDRHWALFLKLIDEFGEDRKHLIAPMNLTTHNNDDKGIHVFVDASNIFIGFNDQLKRSRGISANARVPPVSLSFDGLALLMERRRPVAKRVLAGSMPHLPAFDKAKAVGYECNILEKVYKARELTDRQIYFRDMDRRQHGRVKAPRGSHGNAGLLSTSPSNGYMSGVDDLSGAASGSETTTTGPQYAPAKMIEQGVDEILHLKIAHSVMDYETPATMVLATGDAAQAEYSDGFMAMVRRALVKGWKVELVSWSKNISSMYLQASFRQKWGDHFRVILLDDYAEELLDM